MTKKTREIHDNRSRPLEQILLAAGRRVRLADMIPVFRGHDRSRPIREGETSGKGPIVYWMNRDMRLEDNWALLHAYDWAKAEDRPLVVAYNLLPAYLGGRPRHLWFKLEALRELSEKAEALSIPFTVFFGEDATKQMVTAFKKWDVAGWVTDFCPLRLPREWKVKIDQALQVPAVEVDAHNIVPCWIASPKLEVGARTLRPKIHRLLPTFLTNIPALKKSTLKPFRVPACHWNRWAKEGGADAEGVDWIVPGAKAAHKALKEFVGADLNGYDEDRNDPTKDAQSNLSPWLHYGNISAQRIAWDVRASKTIPSADKEAFLEELIVRRELSDNFCYYQPRYDSVSAFSAWATKSLFAHVQDERDFIYDYKTFERAKTHDDLWNAAQREMVVTGKMHGYMRMYWAKKLLEWTKTPADALAIGLKLNDAYELDGRDPNGYAGMAWSVGGIHDRAWFSRPVFGNVRYMNRNGCARKFDVEAYILRWIPAGERVDET